MTSSEKNAEEQPWKTYWQKRAPELEKTREEVSDGDWFFFLIVDSFVFLQLKATPQAKDVNVQTRLFVGPFFSLSPLDTCNRYCV